MHQIKGLFFDLFWTVIEVSSPPDGASSAPQLLNVLRSQGITLDPTEFMDLFNHHRDQVLRSWSSGVEDEVLCRDKMQGFLQALDLSKLGYSGSLKPLIEQFVSVHMNHIVQSTRLPDGNHSVLKNFSQVYPLALVSNFDDGTYGRKILQYHDIDQFFKTVVISADLGKRKPHAILFETALENLGLNPSEVLMVGDSPLCDVEGARRVGIRSAWMKPAKMVWPNDINPPDFVLTHLADLGKILKP